MANKFIPWECAYYGVSQSAQSFLPLSVPPTLCGVVQCVVILVTYFFDRAPHTYSCNIRNGRERMKNLEKLHDKSVIGSDGEEIGTIDKVYGADEHDEEPVLAVVSTGWLRSSLLPLIEAHVNDDDEVVVPYTKDTVEDAPDISPDEALPLQEGDDLYTHYDLGSTKKDEE